MQHKFPKGFLWGTSTSSHQVEGGNKNQWSEWEKKNAARLASEAKKKNGRLRSWHRIQKDAENPQNYISGSASDHYNRFEEDFDIAKSLGHTAHRLSIEWSRIEPREGAFDEKEIKHYQNVIKALRARNIEPFVTLWHWTLPVWLAEKGGLAHKKFPHFFNRFCEKIAASYKEDVTFWITINEPEVYIASSFIVGDWPPQKKNIYQAYMAHKHLIEAHKLAYTTIHAIVPDAKVGIAASNSYLEPRTKHFFDRLTTRINTYLRNHWFLDRIRMHQDLIGLNYYSREKLGFMPFHIRGTAGFFADKNENGQESDLGWAIFPEGIYHVLKDISSYGKPIYITENGLADARDALRTEFIKNHLLWVQKAITEGVDVRGYLHWSLMDNFEWSEGFWPRFGLIEIDRKTLARTIRQSAYAYAEIIKNNGF